MLPGFRRRAAATTAAASRHSLLNAMLRATDGRFEIYHVTNTNPSGAGSFVDAVTGGSTATTRVVVFDICGGARSPAGSSGPVVRRGHRMRGNLFVAGETAPVAGDGSGGGFNVHSHVRVNGSNIVVRHIRYIPSRPAGGAVPTFGGGTLYEAARGITVSDGATLQNIVFQNCEVNHGIDTSLAFANRDDGSTTNFVFLNCVVAEALSDAKTQDRDSLAYGHQYTYNLFRRCYRHLIYGSLFFCMSYRTPLLGGDCEVMWTNNFHYNMGEPGPQDRWSALGGIDLPKIWPGSRVILDWSHNAVRGGAQSNSEEIAHQYISYMGEKLIEVGDVHGYFAGNRFYSTWSSPFSNGSRWDSLGTYYGPNLYFDRIATDRPTIVGWDGDYPYMNFAASSPWGALGGLALPTTIKDAVEVEGYVLAYAGAHPANRDANSRRIVADVVAETARVNVGPCPTFADPTLTTAAVDVPHGLGTSHLAGGDGAHPAVAGYDAGAITPLEQWLHARHLAALGIPSGAADYDPDVAGRWIATRAHPVLA